MLGEVNKIWRLLRSCSRIDTLKTTTALLQWQTTKINVQPRELRVMCSMCVYCVCACCVCGLQNGISGACKDKTVGMCSWSNVKQTGSLPLPKSGANGDMYVREALPQASAHLLPGLCEQNGVLRGTARPGPLVGPRSPALAVFGTPRSSPL